MIKKIMVAVLMMCSLGAMAKQVGDMTFDETIKVDGKELKLNGAGMRQIFVVKVYGIGLYVGEKSKDAAKLQADTGYKRLVLNIQREVDSDEFGQLFITSMNKNSTKEEKAKVVAQTTVFGEIFSALGVVKKGDIIHLDWAPGVGTVTYVNGKKVGKTLPDIAFYNAVLRIWVGDSPASSTLKNELLGN